MALYDPNIKEISWQSVVRQLFIMGLMIMIYYLTGCSKPFIYGCATYTLLSFILRTVVPRSHNKGVRLIKKEKYDDAIQCFQMSINFFNKNKLLDKFGFIFLLNSSTMTYEEMGVCNIIYCLCQSGERTRGAEMYRQLIKDLPNIKKYISSNLTATKVNLELYQSDSIEIIDSLSNTINESIDRKIEGDLFDSIDEELQVRPEISKVDYYRLHGMDFNWIILEPMSQMVTDYNEKNTKILLDSIKIISAEQKLLYFWWYLDGQVGNGGFSQFIYNGYDRYFPTILNGLKLLPNQSYYNLVKSVYNYYLNSDLHNFDRNNLNYFEDKFYENSILSLADSKYYKLSKQLYSDIEEFIRLNQSKFIQPIDEDFSGIAEYRKGEIYETLEVKNGIANGQYNKYENGIIIEDITYADGQIKREKMYINGLLSTDYYMDETDLNLKHSFEYYPNGNLKQYRKQLVSDEHNSNLIFEDVYHENKIIKSEHRLDNNNVIHIKKYFTSGKIRSYRKLYNRYDPNVERYDEFIICYNENGKQILFEGNGIFEDLHEYEYGKTFYKHIYVCKNYLAHGKSKLYKNGKLSLVSNYINGFEDGITIDYNEDGKEEQRRVMKNGKMIKRIES
ncbi:MAG: DUF4375 domain-containing protein [Saprospiraceae bacterium]|nr:DUF4375 domain-containing protein [Saprospiraceae bacterium]